MPPNKKTLSLVLSLIAGVMLGRAVAAAAEFSADLVISSARGQTKPASGRLYADDRKVRIETTDFKNGYFLVNVDADSAVFIRPAQHLFMDARQSSPLTQILVPVDRNDPCRAWAQVAKIAGVTDQSGPRQCQRLGTTAVGKRSTIEYLVTSRDGKSDYGWIDPQLSFPLKFLFHDGTAVELVNIREGHQPPELFKLPANLQKFDPHQLIERTKQSDVWVEPPK
jgi:hypothetical protein